ncbi:MAG: hypothetical protein GX154_05895 [Clostridiales bacterium]|nr:hypothetical protein [Clostridiales bacterium]
MDYKKSYLIKEIGLWVGLAIAIIFGLTEIEWIAFVGVVIMLGSIFQTCMYYKCPNCNKPFNIRSKKPNYCPECGYKLEDEDV